MANKSAQKWNEVAPRIWEATIRGLPCRISGESSAFPFVVYVKGNHQGYEYSLLAAMDRASSIAHSLTLPR
jgi:hypothetical protein